MSNWDNMLQWELVLPPSRPTEEELHRIIEVVSKYRRDCPVALLGSTPEFRNVLYDLGFNNVYIFDRSNNFYTQMSELIPKAVCKNEKILHGDWLETLPQHHNEFQFILSDLTMGNIIYENRKNFYDAIYNALISSGVFIDKVLAFDFPIPSLNELFEKYEKKPINLRTVNDFSSEVLFCSELVTINQVVDSTKFYEIIKKGYYSDKIKLIAQKSKMITPEGFIWYYGKPWHELSTEYFSLYDFSMVYPEIEVKSPYFHRTKQIFSYKY